MYVSSVLALKYLSLISTFSNITFTKPTAIILVNSGSIKEIHFQSKLLIIEI